MQRHRRRSEHWIVVEGAPEVTIGENTRRVETNQSVYIESGELHRLSNPGNKPAILIEVQTGDYLGEDDIERIEDHYNREPRETG